MESYIKPVLKFPRAKPSDFIYLLKGPIQFKEMFETCLLFFNWIWQLCDKETLVHPMKILA